MFQVRFVDDDRLPVEVAWVIGVDADENRFIFMKRGAAECPSSWEEVWEYGHFLNAPALRVAV